LRVEEQRTQALTAARQQARASRWSEAAAQAMVAHELRADEESRRLLAVCHLMRRDFERAWQFYAAAR
jgi:hypothetical protein